MELALQASRYHVLPDAGGILDQRAGLVRRMVILENVYHAVRQWHNAKDVGEWSKRNPEAWAIVAKVLKLRREHGGD